MVKNSPPKAIQLWMKSVAAAKSKLNKPAPAYGFVSGNLLKTSLQTYCAKISYSPK